MILCFSGTGNSRYIAKKIADELQDEIVDMNAKNQGNRLFANENRQKYNRSGSNLCVAYSTNCIGVAL